MGCMRAQRQPSERRTALLDAALDLFDSRGYAATTMSAIQKQAQASIGSLYHHFPSKAHFAAQLQIRALADYQSTFSNVLTAHPNDAQAAVREAVHTHLRWVSENPRDARLLYTLNDPDVATLAAEDIAHLNKQFFAVVDTWYRSHSAQGTLREVPFDTIAWIWIGPAQEAARAHLTAHPPLPIPPHHIEALATAAWNALRNP